ITKTLNLMGGAAAVDAGGASGAAALNACIDHLRARDCDMMICAGGQRCMGLAAYKQFSLWKQLALKSPRSPLNRESNGFVPGEGVGVVILKRLSDAQRDGDTVHGVVRGIGSARSECIGEAMVAAIRRGLENANVAADDVA